MKIHSKLEIHTDKCSPQLLRKAQIFLDNTVVKDCDPYVPFDRGILKDSGEDFTVPGSGIVTWDTPYAQKQYYEGKSNGLRGARWLDRAKADRKEKWEKGVGKILGGDENGSNH